MAAKIDIEALKIFTKSRTNEAENLQKIKTASLDSRFTRSATSWHDRPDARQLTPGILTPGTSWR